MTPEEQKKVNQYVHEREVMIQRDTHDIWMEHMSDDVLNRNTKEHGDGGYIPYELVKPDEGSPYRALHVWNIMRYQAMADCVPDENREVFQYLVGFYERKRREFVEQTDYGIALRKSKDDVLEDPNLSRQVYAELTKFTDTIIENASKLGQDLGYVDTLIAGVAGLGDLDMQFIPEEDFLKLPREMQMSGAYQPIDTDMGMEEDLAQYGPPSLQGKHVKDFCDFVTDRPKEVRHITMDFRDNELIDANRFLSNLHSKNGKNMTLVEKHYGEAVFEKAFTVFYDKAHIEQMQDAGIDQFDLIFINGKTANELFADKYKGMETKERERLLKCEVVAAKMDPKNKIGVVRLVNNPDNSFAFGEVIAVKTEGTLHEPKHTLMQRFLSVLKIRPIVPLQEKFEQANQKMEQTKVETEAALRSSSKLEIGMLNRASQANSMKRVNELGKEETVNQEYKMYFTVDENYLPKFETSAKGIIPKAQLSRSTSVLGILYGNLLNSGMSLSEIIDPSKRESEKCGMAQQILRAAKTPEGLAAMVAEANLGFQKLNLNKELSAITGHAIRNSAEMKAALQGRDRNVILPVLQKVSKMGQEVVQISLFVDGRGGNGTPDPNVKNSPRRAAAQDTFRKIMGPEGEKGFRKLDNFTHAVKYLGKEEMDFYTSDEYKQNSFDSLSTDNISKAVIARSVSEDYLCDLADDGASIRESTTKSFDQDYFLNQHNLEGVSREKQIDYLVNGEKSAAAGEIKEKLGLTSEKQIERDERAKESEKERKAERSKQFGEVRETVDKTVEHVESTKRAAEYQEPNRGPKKMTFSELTDKKAKEAPVAYRKPALEMGSVVRSKAKSPVENAGPSK